MHAQDLAAPAPPHLGAVLGASHFVGRMQTTRPTDMPASFDAAADLLHGLLEDLTADAPQVGINATSGGFIALHHEELRLPAWGKAAALQQVPQQCGPVVPLASF